MIDSGSNRRDECENFGQRDGSGSSDDNPASALIGDDIERHGMIMRRPCVMIKRYRPILNERSGRCRPDQVAHSRLALSQRGNSLLDATIGDCEAFMLTEMFGPRGDEERLHVQAGVFDVAKDFPAMNIRDHIGHEQLAKHRQPQRLTGPP